MVILLALAVAAGLGYLAYRTVIVKPSHSNNPQPGPNVSSVQHAATPASFVKVTAEGGTRVESPDGSYSVKVPRDWFYLTCKDANSSNPSVLQLAPNQSFISTTICQAKGAEFYSLNIPDSPSSACGKPTQNPQAASTNITNLTLNKVTGYRLESVDNSSSSTPGAKRVLYSFCSKTKQYMANYFKSPDDPDSTTEFDQMAQTWSF